MKCISKASRLFIGVTLTSILISGCGVKEYSFAYDRNLNNSSYSTVSVSDVQKIDSFASNLCIAVEDITVGASVDMSEAQAAGLFDVNDTNVIYAKNVHEKLNPASITKILTALCALKYGNLDDTLTASKNVHIEESGAVMLGLKEGDTMTLDQALHALLLKSANDVALLIAEHIGGSVDGFSEIMNREALNLGATNSHFVNPHGLTDPNHYTTIYDLYLICNETIKYDKFVEIIHTSSYNSVYHDKDGNPKEFSLSTTNAYLKNEAFAPENITVIGGKTGTTSAAKNCLLLYSKDQSGNSYISIILKSPDRTLLYKQMTELLAEIS